jgi:hypothetical protein
MMMNFIKRQLSNEQLNETEKEETSLINFVGNNNNNKRNSMFANEKTEMNNIISSSSSTKTTTNPIVSTGSTIDINGKTSKINASNTSLNKQIQPASPVKSNSDFSFSSMFTAARDVSASITGTLKGGGQNQIPSTTNILTKRQLNSQKEKTKVLLIIDDINLDWTRYFKGKKLAYDFDIRVEQASFKDINLASYCDGTIVDIDVERNGTRVVRSFRPDFVLIRENIRNIKNDWRNIVIGLQYGMVQSLNSLYSVYNFGDKPWVVSFLNLYLKFNQKKI